MNKFDGYCFWLYPQQDIQLENPKYCKLYPNYHITSRIQKPRIQVCKTLYTKCDFCLEHYVHDCILELEKLVKEYQILATEEIEFQKGLLDEMWIESQRYLILTSVACVKPYPEIISTTTEKRALCKFHINLKKAKNSNCLLTASMNKIITCRNELNHLCSHLDISVESPFLIGSYNLKSLPIIRQLLNDIFQYFYCILCKLKCWAQLLDPGDSFSIEDYINLLKSKNECDLLERLDNCQCLRAKQNECKEIIGLDKIIKIHK